MRNLASRGFAVARSGVGLWLEHNAFLHAGALAFFTVFSLAPTLIIAVTVIGVVLGEGAARGEIVAQLQSVMGANAAAMVEHAILASRPAEAGLGPTLFGIVAILIGATTVFVQLHYSINTLWEVRSVAEGGWHRSFLQFARTRLLALVIVLLIGLGLLCYFVAVAVIQTIMANFDPFGALKLLNAIFGAAQGAVAVLITTLFVAALFKVLPDVLVCWCDVLPGAFVTALMLTVGQYGIETYLAETALTSVYGAAGSLLVILFWVYFSVLLLLLGAALTRAWIVARGRQLPQHCRRHCFRDRDRDDPGQA